MNFIVYAPGDYSRSGGGCIALHKLAHNIELLGEQCFIVCDSTNPNYKGRHIYEKDAIEMCRYGQTMVIYPEVICGNPLQSPHVMRWILYDVRKRDEHGIFGENDLIYKYAPMFTLRYPQTIHGELRAMELNLDIFKDNGLERSGTCYIRKKNPDKPTIHAEGSICIDDAAHKGDFEHIAHIFNTTKTFYAYDDATFFSVFASLCGCDSIVVPRVDVTAEQWYNNYPYFKYGIAYGIDELPHASRTRNLMRGALLSLESLSITQTQQFINKAKSVVG